MSCKGVVTEKKSRITISVSEIVIWLLCQICHWHINTGRSILSKARKVSRFEISAAGSLIWELMNIFA